MAMSGAVYRISGVASASVSESDCCAKSCMDGDSVGIVDAEETFRSTVSFSATGIGASFGDGGRVTGREVTRIPLSIDETGWM